MKECLELDAIVTIGGALNWDVNDGLQHLQTCDLCRERMEILRGIRTAFAATEPVESKALSGISDAVRAAARSESRRIPAAPLWANMTEAALAGATAVALVVSAGIPINSATAALITFVAGAALLLAARASGLFRSGRATPEW